MELHLRASGTFTVGLASCVHVVSRASPMASPMASSVSQECPRASSLSLPHDFACANRPSMYVRYL